MIPRVCFVTDPARTRRDRSLEEVLTAAFRGGLRMVVLREFERSAREWAELAEAIAPLRAEGLRAMPSRRLDMARAHAMDGVHLAADAVDVARARDWLGPDAWIGYSAHTAEEALDAQARGATYVTLSPIFATSSKPGTPGRGTTWLANACEKVDIPVLALGGITAARAGEIRRAGAWGVACVEAIGGAPDPAAAVAELRNEWRNIR